MKQRNKKDSVIAVYDTDKTNNDWIPLWLFGFLY